MGSTTATRVLALDEAAFKREGCNAGLDCQAQLTRSVFSIFPFPVASVSQ